MTKTYLICWKIELDADTPQDAARLALSIQRDPASLATVFDVWQIGSPNTAIRIDLAEEDPPPPPENIAFSMP